MNQEFPFAKQIHIKSALKGPYVVVLIIYECMTNDPQTQWLHNYCVILHDSAHQDLGVAQQEHLVPPPHHVY